MHKLINQIERHTAARPPVGTVAHNLQRSLAGVHSHSAGLVVLLVGTEVPRNMLLELARPVPQQQLMDRTPAAGMPPPANSACMLKVTPANSSVASSCVVQA